MCLKMKIVKNKRFIEGLLGYSIEILVKTLMEQKKVCGK